MSLFVVIGPGAVGAAVAAQLQFGHLPYTLVGRNGLYQKPLKVTLRDQTTLLQPVPAEQFRWQDVTCVFICVKVYDLGACLKAYAPKFPDGATAVIVANGAVDALVAKAKRDYPKQHWRLGVAHLGSTEASGGFVLAGNGGSVAIGALPPAEQTASEKLLLATSPKFFQVVNDIMPVYRKKWLMNAVANSYCGAHRISRNDKLMAYEAELREVFDEAFALNVELWGAWTATRAELWDYFLSVIKATAENENSMARDVRLGRKTETEYLAGVAVNYPGYPRLKELHQILSGQ